MGFYLEFVDKSSIIHFQGPARVVETLVEAIQESLTQRVTQIYVELPDDDAQVAGIREVLSKLSDLLAKSGQVLQIINGVGFPDTRLQKELATIGCTFIKREEIVRTKIRSQRASAKDKAEKMLQELKQKDRRELLFGLDFKKLYKEADFEVFPDLEKSFLTVRTHIEMEIRLKERLNREKKLYASRIIHLRKVASVSGADEAQFRELQRQEDRYKNLKAEIYDLYRQSSARAQTELSIGQDTRLRELEELKQTLSAELEALRKKG